MATTDGDDTVGSGEWGLFVARLVREIRSEFDEATANRVAAILQSREAYAIEATREQVRAANAVLERTLSDAAEARRAHERLQADVARMESTVRAAKRETAEIRTKANELLATRRAQIDEAIAKLEAVHREPAASPAEVTAPDDRAVVDLRDDDIDLRHAALDEREAELDEWEAELVARAREIDRRAAAPSSTLPPPGPGPARWGRRLE